MKPTLDEHDQPGWYECTDKFGRRVMRYWTGGDVRNYPAAAWHWPVDFCRDYVGPLLPLGMLRQAFAEIRAGMEVPPTQQQRPGFFRRLFSRGAKT